MMRFNDIDKGLIKTKIKDRCGSDAEIFFADEVPTNTFYSDKEKLNDDIYSNQFSLDHVESNEELIVVKSHNKYGIFDSQVREVLPIQYQKIIWISKDRVILCKEGKYGLSDTKGTCLIPCEYDKIRPIPFVKEYSYGYNGIYRQVAEEVNFLAAKSKGKDGYVETGFNMNGQMAIRPCYSIYPGEYYSLIDTWGEFPYICTEVYRNLILELFPRRYYLQDLKNLGFDYTQYIEEHEDCSSYICGKIVHED